MCAAKLSQDFSQQDHHMQSATTQDIGKYLSQAELSEWWTDMHNKFPQLFESHYPCPKQHPPKTKLSTHLDQNPSRPIRVEVVGSKFRKDFATEKYAFYVVKHKQSGELAFIDWIEAHEAHIWQVGWDARPLPFDVSYY
jgi:hypothetical protein